MAIVTALLVIEIILLILTLPIKVGVIGHASLYFTNAQIDVSLFSLRVFSLRAKMNDGYVSLTLNGKAKNKAIKTDKDGEDKEEESEKKKDKSKNPVIYLKLFEMMKKEGVFEIWNLSLLFSGYDAKNTSLITAFIYAAILPRLKMNVYAAKRENTFEFDGKIKIKINLLQILTLISYKTRLSARKEDYTS